MSGSYPALARLRRGQRRSEEAPASGGFFSDLLASIHHQWKVRSSRFFTGLGFFFAAIVLFGGGVVFLVSGIYTTIKFFTGEIAALFVMAVACVAGGGILMSRALRNLSDSVDFNKKELNLKITD